MKIQEDILNKNIFKQSGVFRFTIWLMAILNVVYVSVVIYKSSINKPLLVKGTITEQEFSQLQNLTTYTSILEVIFIILALVGVFLLFTEKYKWLLKSYCAIQLTFLIAIFIVNEALSWVFSAPGGDMSQNLIGPFIIVFLMVVYLIIKSSYRTLINKAM